MDGLAEYNPFTPTLSPEKTTERASDSRLFALQRFLDMTASTAVQQRNLYMALSEGFASSSEQAEREAALRAEKRVVELLTDLEPNTTFETEREAIQSQVMKSLALFPLGMHQSIHEQLANEGDAEYNHYRQLAESAEELRQMPSETDRACAIERLLRLWRCTHIEAEFTAEETSLPTHAFDEIASTLTVRDLYMYIDSLSGPAS